MSVAATTDASTIFERFSALAISEGLTKRSKDYTSKRKEYIAAEVQHGFAASFGANVSSLQSWQQICTTVGIQGADQLSSIRQCKKELKAYFVNLVDLVDAKNAGTIMTKGVFTNNKALAAYIKRSKKVFPKEKAKANALLRQFLIVVV